MRKSKDLAKAAHKSEDNSPGLVDGFMKAYKKAGIKMESWLDYSVYPTLAMHHFFKQTGHGSLKSQQQMLKAAKVVMTECVQCVTECPAYMKQPFKANDFDEFQNMAMGQCRKSPSTYLLSLSVYFPSLLDRIEKI